MCDTSSKFFLSREKVVENNYIFNQIFTNESTNKEKLMKKREHLSRFSAHPIDHEENNYCEGHVYTKFIILV
jgi:hypothetical protein